MDSQQPRQVVDLTELITVLSILTFLTIMLLAGVEAARDFEGEPVRYPSLLWLMNTSWQFTLPLVALISISYWTGVAILVRKLFPNWTSRHLPWYRRGRWPNH